MATVAPNLPVVGDEADAALLRQLPPRRACVGGCATAGSTLTSSIYMLVISAPSAAAAALKSIDATLQAPGGCTPDPPGATVHRLLDR